VGKGSVISEKCNECRGQGTKNKNENIDIVIPHGTYTGCNLALQGQGNASVDGGPSGDLYIYIEEIPHDILKREGINLTYECFINFADAIFGTSIEVPSLEGDIKFNIERGTPSGKVFSLKGRGLPTLKDYGQPQKGNLLVKVNVYVPINLSDEDKELVEKIKENKSFNAEKI
jgi:molecular chaperone DnaJ